MVDDEAEIVNVHQRLLQQLGYTVTAETDSLAALETFSRHPGAYQAVFTDQTMPHQTGMNLAAEILKLRPDLPVILCTGYSDLISEEEARKNGIRELLLNPIGLQHMANTVARLFRRA